MAGFVSRSTLKPARAKITEYSDALAKYRLLDARRQLIIDANRQPALLRLMDKKMQYLGTVVSERRGDWERLLDDSGVGTLSLQWSSWLADLCAHKTRVEEDLHLIVDPNPNNRSWRTRMGFKVTDVRAVKHDDGTRTVEIDFISFREHAKHILLGSTPLSAPEFQPLKAWIWVENLRSNLALATFINLARSFWPIAAIPISIFNPVHWLTTKVGNLSPLHWPIQPQFVNPILDQSRILPLTAKWQDLHTISKPLMADAGVCLIDYIWLKGEDTTSPHPELAALIGEEAAMPSRSCVILAFEDRSGRGGPTGTAADGALQLIGVTLDNTITEIIMPIDADGDGKTDSVFAKLLGVAPEKPSLVWRDCEYSGLLASEHRMKRPGAQTIYTGGHSPTWVCAPLGTSRGAQTQGRTSDSTKSKPSSSATPCRRSAKSSCTPRPAVRCQRSRVRCRCPEARDWKTSTRTSSTTSCSPTRASPIPQSACGSTTTPSLRTSNAATATPTSSPPP